MKGRGDQSTGAATARPPTAIGGKKPVATSVKPIASGGASAKNRSESKESSKSKSDGQDTPVAAKSSNLALADEKRKEMLEAKKKEEDRKRDEAKGKREELEKKKKEELEKKQKEDADRKKKQLDDKKAVTVTPTGLK